MQLPLLQAQQIMEGQKTTVRTRRRPDVRRGSMLAIDGYKMVPNQDGDLVKVVTRKPARVRVLSVCRENDVQALSEADIRAEGFRSQEKFLAAYEAANGVRDGACWVLRLEVADRMRLLLPAGRPKFSEKGYGGGSDVLDAGEGVSDDELEAFARVNGMRREQFLGEQPLGARLEEAVRLAERSGIDVGPQLRSIEGRVRSLEARLRRKVA